MKPKGLKISLVLTFFLAFVLVPNVWAWVINSVDFDWVPNPSGYSFTDAILVHRCINANYHWLTSEELSPNPRRLGSWKYGSISDCVAHYPVYSVAVGDVVKIGVGASDTDPGAESSLYTHPNTRFWRCERTSSSLNCAEITTPPPPQPPSGGSNPFWYLRNSNSGGVGDITFQYGRNGDIPVVGDWNGDGIDTPGVFRSATATWYLRNSNSGGVGDLEFVYGVAGDIPVVGDWNGDGIDTVGVFRNDTRTWYLRNSNSGGAGDIAFQYGRTGYTPIVGDWNGDGTDTVGVFHIETRTWYLRNSNSGGVADMEFQYGEAHDIPVVGDWNGDGKDTIGVFRNATKKWYLRNTNSGGTANLEFPYGNPSDTPIVGDWNNDNSDTIGVVRADAATGLISNLQVSSGKSYEIGACSLGARYYIDRDFTISGFSNSDYDGLTCIKTANDDKLDSSSNLIEFDLSSPTRIYIYWDRRSDDDYRPGWMRQLWDPNGKEVYVSGDSMEWFEVSSCDSTPGHIVLGGPYSDGGGSGVKSMYVVAFRPIEEGDKLCTASTSTTTPYHSTTNFRASIENGTTTIWLQICGNGKYHRLRSEITAPYHEVLGDWTKNAVNGCSSEYPAVIGAVPGEQFRFYTTVMDDALSETTFLQQARMDSCTVKSPGQIACQRGSTPPDPDPDPTPPGEKTLAVSYVDQVFVQQTREKGGAWYECGPSSVSMFLHYTGKENRDVSNNRQPTLDVAEKVLGPEGFYWGLGANLLAEKGFDVSNKTHPTFEDLKDSIDRGYPVVMGWAKNTGGHVILVIGYKEPDTIIIHDPMGGKNWSGLWCKDDKRNDYTGANTCYGPFDSPRTKGQGIEYSYDEITNGNWLYVGGVNTSPGNATTLVSTAGGALIGNRVRVEIPAGFAQIARRNSDLLSSLATNVIMTYTARTPLAHPINSGRHIASFRLEAATETGQPIQQLDREFQVTFESAGIAVWESDGSMIPASGATTQAATSTVITPTLFLAYWNQSQQQWVTLPSTVDFDNHQITAQTDHVGDFVLYASISPNRVYLPLVIRQ